jgi:hypothetical protein
MASRKKETVLRKVLKHERKTSPKANIPGPPAGTRSVILASPNNMFIVHLHAQKELRP